MKKNKKMLLTMLVIIAIVVIITGITISIIINMNIKSKKVEKDNLNTEKNQESQNVSEDEKINESNLEIPIQTDDENDAESLPKNDNEQTNSNITSTNSNSPQIIDNSSNNSNNDNRNNNNNNSNNNNDNNNQKNDELEEKLKKWFIAQFDIAKQQYILNINQEIYSKENEKEQISQIAKNLYVDYMQEVENINKRYASSETRDIMLTIAKENYQSSASVYTQKNKTLQDEIDNMKQEIANPNVDNILSIVMKNCNISLKETYDYYNKYL